VATDNWIDLDAIPTVEQDPLGPEELKARDYWRRFLPQLVASLERSGPDALDQAIRQAWYEREHAKDLLISRSPELTHDQAMEPVNHLLYPPAEPSTTPA